MGGGSGGAMRSMSKSALCQGWAEPDQVRVPRWRPLWRRKRSDLQGRPYGAVEFYEVQLVVGEGGVGGEGEDDGAIVPLEAGDGGGLCRLRKKAVGLRTPLDPSAPTPDPSITGSKKASCRVPGGGVTVTTLSLRVLWFRHGIAQSIESALLCPIEAIGACWQGPRCRCK